MLSPDVVFFPNDIKRGLKIRRERWTASAASLGRINYSRPRYNVKGYLWVTSWILLHNARNIQNDLPAGQLSAVKASVSNTRQKQANVAAQSKRRFVGQITSLRICLFLFLYELR